MNEEESSRGVLLGTVSEFPTSESKVGERNERLWSAPLPLEYRQRSLLYFSIATRKIDARHKLGTTQFSLISTSFLCDVMPDLIEIFDGETS